MKQLCNQEQNRQCDALIDKTTNVSLSNILFAKKPNNQKRNSMADNASEKIAYLHELNFSFIHSRHIFKFHEWTSHSPLLA